MVRFAVSAIAIALSSAAAAAEEQPICADRPGKATGTCTVPVGHWQLETDLADWTLQKEGGERETSLAIGEGTVKYGLTANSNIEVDIAPWQRVTSRVGELNETTSGFGDLSVLYKHRLTSSDAAVQVATMPFVKAPTAKHSIGNGKWEGGLLLPIGIAIPKSSFSIGLTPEIDWAADSDGHGHHASMMQAGSLGWQANDRLSLSAELWGQWDWDPAGTTKEYSADGAVAYLLSYSVQLDGGANFGLNRQTPDIELYTGVSVRF